MPNAPEELFQDLEKDTSRFHYNRVSRFTEIARQYKQIGDNVNAEHLNIEATAFLYNGLGDSYPHSFTNSQLKHLAERARSTKNPIHGSCFADVVWDFSFPKNPEIARIAIDWHIKTAEVFKRNKWGVDFGKIIKRAAYLAFIIKDSERIEKIKKIIIHYARELDASNEYRFCLDLVEAIIKSHLDLENEERAELIGILEKGVKYYEGEHPKRDDSLGPVDGPNEHLVRSFLNAEIELLSDKGSEKGEMIRKLIAQSYERQGDRAFKSGNCIAGMVFYRNAEQAFLGKPDKDRIRIKLVKAGLQAESELVSVSAKVEIKKENIEAYVSPLLKGNLDECLTRLAAAPHFIPNIKETRKSIEDRSREFPLLFTIPKMHLKEGHITAHYDSDKIYDEALDRELIMEIQMAGVFRSYLFDSLIERGLDTNCLIGHFNRWGYCKERNLKMLRIGFECFFAGQYPSSLHILIPQFEDILRAFLQEAGRPVSLPPHGVAMLEHLLSDESFVSTAGEDLIRYYELVLTDGLKLRHYMAHGLLDPEQMTKPNVELIIHLLLTLTRFKVGN